MSSSDYSKNRVFIIGQSEQQLKIQPHFGISDPIIGEKQWYDDAAPHALKFIWESFGNICLFYSMKSFLDLPKSLVDA